MMTEEPIRPFDWWMLAIEVGVLLLVAYEVGATIFSQIQGAKRRKSLRRIEAEVRNLISFGEALKNHVPEFNAQVHGLDWPNSVARWIEKVEAYLTPLSSSALCEFQSYAHPNLKYREFQLQSGHIMYASGYLGDVLERLNMKLENLRRIARDTSAYF